MDSLNDIIKYETGSITITYGLDENGEALFNVNLKGDIPYTTALGLLVVAKDHLDNIYFQDTDL